MNDSWCHFHRSRVCVHQDLSVTVIEVVTKYRVVVKGSVHVLSATEASTLLRDLQNAGVQ